MPLCGAVADLSADPIRTPAAWHVLPLHVTVSHAARCPATFTEAEREHFDARAFGPDIAPPRDRESRGRGAYPQVKQGAADPSHTRSHKRGGAEPMSEPPETDPSDHPGKDQT